jgi:hypothetical protein
MDELDEVDEEYFALLDAEAPIERRRRLGTRLVALALLVGLVVVFVLQPGGIGFWHRAPERSGTSERESDTTVAQLHGGPGGRYLDDADWEEQVGSAVLLGVGQPRCGGAITELDGERYVTSARHCLQDVLADDVVSPEPGQAQEVTGRLSGTVRVFDPDSHRVIASLDRIAVGTGDHDLLVATTRAETGAFRRKPARTVASAPAKGDEIATYASSGAVGFVPRRLSGVYLGTHTFTNEGHTVTVDLVGYRQPSARAAIGPGHSGHSPTGAGGSALGPLLFSVNSSTSPAERDRELAAMGASTGIDLAAEGFVAVDESLHLTAADYARFVPILAA